MSRVAQALEAIETLRREQEAAAEAARLASQRAKELRLQREAEARALEEARLRAAAEERERAERLRLAAIEKENR